jgi:flagellin-like hook-associated protein FlgL
MNIASSLAPTLTSNLNAVQASIVDTQTQLATGKKNLNAAQVGIVTRLSAQVAGYNSVVANISAGTSVLNVSNTALTSISNIISQCKDIATQAANAGLTAGDRTALNTTYTQLMSQVTSLITNATVNGDNILLSSGTSPAIQTGITGASTTTVTNLALDTALTAAVASTVTTNVLAGTAMDLLTTALNTISSNQSTLSALQVGLNAQSAASASLSTNLQATVDSMQSIDSTALQAKLQSLNNQQSIGYYLISQMNTASAAMLTIFR